MTTNEIEAALQAFGAAGADRGLFYLSTPITTGRRELELVEKHGTSSREEVRSQFPQEWRELVLHRNEQAATDQADIFVDTAALGRVVVNPARIHRPHWLQSDYDALWARLIQEFPTVLVPLEGWAYSRGARLEVALGLSLHIPIVNFDGSLKRPEQLRDELAVAESEIQCRNWEPLTEDLPPIDLTGYPDNNATTSGEAQLIAPPEESYARQVFVWLAKERVYQVNKFGTGLDDQHTRDEGLDDDGWWSKQLGMYYHRARILGLEHRVGRQALAKFIATGCGLLESVVRVHGELPPPAVSSGETNPASNLRRR